MHYFRFKYSISLSFPTISQIASESLKQAILANRHITLPPTTQPPTTQAPPTTLSPTEDQTPITPSPLVISSNSECSLLQQSSWTSIVIESGLCNNMTGDLEICGYDNLEKIVVRSSSLQNLNSLKICNNEKLQTIQIQSSSLYYVKNVIFESINYLII